MSKSRQVIDGHLQPLNAEAAKVMRPGITFEPSRYMPSETSDSREMPAIRHVEDVDKHLHPLMGFSYARLTILGQSSSDESQWVVRCRCGMYSLRMLGAIFNLANDQDCCRRCHAEARIRRKEMERRLGRVVLPQEMPGACPPRGPLPSGVVLTTKQKRQLRAKKELAEQKRKQAESDKQMSGLRFGRRVFEAPETIPSAMSLAFAKAHMPK